MADIAAPDVPAARAVPSNPLRTPLRVALAATLALGAGYAANSILAARAGFVAHATIDVDGAAVEPALSQGALVRAATALGVRDVRAAEPGLLDRMLVGAGLAEAEGRTDRLARILGEAATLERRGRRLDVAVRDAGAGRSALVANALADALIDEQADTLLAARRAREATEAARLQGLTDAAVAAHKRLAATGQDAADPAQQRAGATKAREAAVSRAQAFRAVLASGSPPLGAEAGLPATVAPLQTTYLDFKRRLAEAHQTMGDRHTTVIALEDGLRQSGRALGAEWKRLAQEADAEATLAKGREADLLKADAARDPGMRDAVAVARAGVLAADGALAQARADLAAPVRRDQAYRLVAPATVPATPSGPSMLLRVLASILAAFAAGLAVMLAPRAMLALRPARPVPRCDVAGAEPAMKDADPATVPVAPEPEIAAPEAGLVPDLVRLAGRPGQPAVVLVGALEADIETVEASLRLARTVAAAGRRTVLVEAERAVPRLAGMLDAQAEPMLVDLMGTLRIAMPDPAQDALHLAPAFADARRLAAGLARRLDVPFFHEAGEAFDLVIVDIGTVEAGDWRGVADATIRVGTPSSRGDALFLDALDGSYATFLGVIEGEGAPAQDAAEWIAGPRLVVDNQGRSAGVGPRALPPLANPRRRHGSR